MPYTLCARQVALYKNSLSIWRPTPATSSTAGERGDDTYTLIDTGVPCFYRYTQNDSDPMGVARLKRRSPLDEDKVKVPVGIDLQDADLVYDTTILADGTQSPNFGTVHRVEGQGKVKPSIGVRELNEQRFQLMTVDDKPNEVGSGALLYGAASFAFAGASALQAPSAPSLLAAVGAGSTFACWIYPTAFHDFGYVFSKGTDKAIYVDISGIVTAFITGTDSNVYAKSATVPLTANTWHFLTFRKDPARNLILLNLDAAAALTLACAVDIQTNTAPLSIGREFNLTNGFEGRIDSAFYWPTRCLTDVEVLRLRNGGTAWGYQNLPRDLAKDMGAGYGLDELTGTRYDATGNGNHLTAGGSVGHATGVA